MPTAYAKEIPFRNDLSAAIPKTLTPYCGAHGQKSRQRNTSPNNAIGRLRKKKGVECSAERRAQSPKGAQDTPHGRESVSRTDQ